MKPPFLVQRNAYIRARNAGLKLEIRFFNVQPGNLKASVLCAVESPHLDFDDTASQARK